jgi:hypothetical protein
MQCEARPCSDAHPLCQHGGGEENGRCGSVGDALREGHKWGKQMVTSVERSGHEFRQGRLDWAQTGR